MVFIGGILSFIVLVTVLTKGYSQTLDEHTGNVTNCFNGVVEGSCVQATERAFVTKVNAGVKPSSPNPYNCTPYWEVGIAEQCCRKGNGDCIGPYLAVATDPFVFHKDCLGKNQCTRRAAARMDTIYHTHCDHAAYPQQTSYMEIEFLCIDVSKITSITGDPKRNDGQGSTLYLWSGDASSYLPLTTATHECSVETDCDDTIIVISVDLRFATDDANMTCIPEKVLRISDGDQSVQFDCSENNNFTIETLYTSVSNYITLSMENVVNGGHLWLAFQTTMNGNLTVNCRSKDRQNYCEETTTMEDTTTETFTTTESFTTTETFTTTQSLTESSTTIDINMTEFESTTVDISTTVETNSSVDVGKSESKPDKKIGLVVGVVIGALAFLGVMIAIVVVMVKRNKNRKKCEEKQEDKTSDIESGKTPEANGFPSVPPTNHGIINADKSGQNDDSLHNSMANEHLLSINENQDNNMFDATVNGRNGLRKNQVLPILGQVGTVDPINNTLTEDTGEERKRKKKKRKQNVESLNENAENDEENQEEKKKKKKKKRKKIENENEANLEEEPQSYVDETNVQKERKKKRKERNDEEHDDDLDNFNSVTEERKQRKKRKKKIEEEHEGVEHEGEEHRVNNEPELDNAETEESKERKKKKKKRKKKKKVTHLDDEDEAVADVSV